MGGLRRDAGQVRELHGNRARPLDHRRRLSAGRGDDRRRERRRRLPDQDRHHDRCRQQANRQPRSLRRQPDRLAGRRWVQSRDRPGREPERHHLLLGRVQGGAGCAEGRHLRRRGRGSGRHGCRIQPGLRDRDLTERHGHDAEVRSDAGDVLRELRRGGLQQLDPRHAGGWIPSGHLHGRGRGGRHVPLRRLEHRAGAHRGRQLRRQQGGHPQHHGDRLPAGVRDRRPFERRGQRHRHQRGQRARSTRPPRRA